MKAFDRYQSALHRGDYSATKEHMLTFFVHTAQRATCEMHQHALLNLAALHLEMDSPAAAEVFSTSTERDKQFVKGACQPQLESIADSKH
ncbi:hypothetical protein A4X03_0g8029 [Tilletia caries]|uniref:Anaphase-promoting complex subunit 5 domain-containing protein n=2 Tax=Tilletia TaxID=13289 RepID=A0A177U4M8_9BASI|nr:hypothetical protein CF335_g8030 [Tilletia laevis]KAE8242457.1 hypothetical protein A4X03_0g8029 [Tilletia caries]CAD6931060.1 unnamed protein product [Tilletia caries]